MIDLASIIQALHKSLIARLFDALRDLLHSPVERFDFPVVAIGCAVEDLRQAAGIDGVLERRGAFGTERAVVDGAIGIALNIDNLAVFNIDVEATAHSAIGADAVYCFGV